MKTITSIVALCGLTLAAIEQSEAPAAAPPAKQETALQFGNFSVSLAVEDIEASKAFYEKLDFKQVGGDPKQKWVVLQNGTTTIGLFQGMFERNLLTFNPGWTHEKKTLEEFQDVRELQRVLKQRGLELATEAEASGSGPASFVLIDPDGNPILVDQHVPRPKKKP